MEDQTVVKNRKKRLRQSGVYFKRGDGTEQSEEWQETVGVKKQMKIGGAKWRLGWIVYKMYYIYLGVCYDGHTDRHRHSVNRITDTYEVTSLTLITVRNKQRHSITTVPKTIECPAHNNVTNNRCHFNVVPHFLLQLPLLTKLSQ